MINRILNFSLLVLVLAAFVSPSGLSAADSINYFASVKRDDFPVAGREYSIRHTFMYEKGVHNATNYWRGTIVPINSRAYLISLDERSMLLRLHSGETVRVENMPNYTQRVMITIAKRMLAAHPVPIEKFDKSAIAAIKNGVMKLGMTKEQVIMARGYPPGHETPSLDLDTWKYWSSRMVTQSIVFDNGVLVRGRGIR
jgi:hypothetical protein